MNENDCKYLVIASVVLTAELFKEMINIDAR